MRTHTRRQILAAILASMVTVTHAQPEPGTALEIEMAADHSVRLSWPVANGGLMLEETDLLSDFTFWQEVLSPPLTADGVATVSLGAADPARFFRLRERERVRIQRVSPADGESDVAVTRETIFRFNHALAANTFLGTEHVYAEAFGRRLLSRVDLASDRRTVTLFYLEPLPGSARVRVTFNAVGLADEYGRLVDLDGDGQPGGVAAMSFDTLSLTPVPNTAVIGTVYASEPMPGATPGAFSNRPLAGVTITVDGREETMRTVTDESGQFRLEPCPAGDFFVHIDGRTVRDVGAGIRYPDLAYYPFVGKSWHARPGVTNNLAGETGMIYLPLVAAGTLQPVSATEDTVILFPPSVIANDPALAGVSITVPANSLFSDSGVRGGRVGIAPVPPDRLPGPLPPGLEPSIVITVQTDGALNFDRPVPVCFPNLPEPDTGFVLPPGSKQALISFNHDTGQWEAVGSMTVGEDGRLICSDPGAGILAPGWGAVGPEPYFPEGPSPCRPPPSGGPASRPLDTWEEWAEQCRRGCAEQRRIDGAACTLLQVEGEARCNLLPAGPSREACLRGLGASVRSCNERAYFAWARCLERCRNNSFNSCFQNNPPTGPFPFNRLGAAGWDLLDQIVIQVDHAFELLAPYYFESNPIPEDVLRQLREAVADADRLAGGATVSFLRDAIAQSEASLREIAAVIGWRDGGAPSNPIRFRARIRRAGDDLLFVSGRTGPFGDYQLFVPRGGTLEQVSFFDPVAQTYGFVYPRRDQPSRLPNVVMMPMDDSFLDSDGDGLVDVVESILGTMLAGADSDSDGIPDGAEVAAGTDPLDGRPAVQGVIAAADTPGAALGLCVENDRAIVADGGNGVAVFSLVNGLNPLLIAQIDTPGSAQAVACAEGRVAVADGAGGLAILDLGSGAVPALTHQISLGAAVTHVAASGEGAFAGLADNRWARVDLRTGVVTETGLLQEPLHDLAVAGDRLYVLTAHELVVFRIRSDGLQRLGATVQDFPGRLFVGDGLAYLGDPVSFTFLGRQRIVDVTNPNDQRLLAGATEPLPLIYDLADSGSGHLLTVSATAGRFGLLDYDSSDPGVIRRPDNFLPSAGEARAVTIDRGLAYVAAGSAGLEIVNFLAPDTHRQPPTVSLRLADPEAALVQGGTFQVLAPATDDVQVREVEFYVNDVRVARDGSYPFSAWLSGPSDVPGATEVRLRARAVDMAGNATTSAERVLPLGPRNNGPSVLRVAPAIAQRSVTEVTATFRKALDVASLEPGWLQVFAAGPDGQPGTPDDLVVPGGALVYDSQSFELRLPYPGALPAGVYQARVSAAVQGTSGDRLGTPFTWTFRVGDQLFWVNRQGGFWNEPSNWSEARLPEAGDDVVIDVPDRVPIILDGLSASVRSLASRNRLDVRNTTLTVGQTFALHDHLRLIHGTLRGAHVILHPGSQCELIGLAVFDGVTVDGDLLLPPSSQLLVHNGFTLHGTMTLRTSGVVFDGTQTVHAGTFVLPEENPAYLSISHDSVVTLSEAVVIRGRAGNLGFGHSTPGAQRFVHRGRLVADQPPLVNGSLVINGSAFRNEGTVEVVNGGSLTLAGAMRSTDLGTPGQLRNLGGTLRLSGALDNAGQELVFDARTGDWRLDTLTVSGGAITIGLGGKPLPHGLELDGVTVNGTLLMPPSGEMRVRHGLTLNGTIELGGLLAFEGHQTLAAGTIVFGSAPGSIGSLGLIGDTVVTLGAAVEMRGTRGSIGGAWGADGDQRFIHQGALRIDGASAAFTIIGKGFRNEGLVEVANGGSLALSGALRTADLGAPGRLRNRGGEVRLSGALDNSGQELGFNAQTGDWLLDGLIVSGGAITVGAGGTPVLRNFELDGVTLNGTLPVPAGASGRVRNGLTVNGTLECSGHLAFYGDQTLAGGTITFLAPEALLGLEGDTVLTIAANTAIRGGSGRIGYALSLPGQQRIEHFGRITADGPGSVIQIRADGFNNHGTLEELNGGVISMVP